MRKNGFTLINHGTIKGSSSGFTLINFSLRSKTISVNQIGFTLIELMVTVAIIGILAAVGLASYQIVFKNSRDNKRSSDLKFIQTALEQYRGDQFFYPSAITLGSPLTNATGNIAGTTVTKTYLNNTPSDPSTSNAQYCYIAQTSAGGSCDNSTAASYCTKYFLDAKLENPPSGSPTYTCNSITTYNSQVSPP